MTARILVVCGGSGVSLLGQRDVLGVHAEVQVDWRGEILPVVRQSLDYYSQYVELDRDIGTVGRLFQEARDWVGEKPSRVSESSAYLREKFYSGADIRHLRFLLEHVPVTMPLDRGKALFPAVGGLVVRHPRNRVALEQVLERITAPLGLGPENPVEAWIVASTVGGVGAGVPRFVGAFLAHFVRQRYAGTPVSLYFIRIGPLTYRSTNPRQTALNAFFAVAADAAYALRIPREFPETTTRWFYIDFPDAGMGERGGSLRARMVEIATKVMMWEALRESLQGLLAHNQGIPMGVARVGFWEGDLTEQRKYYEALRGLRERLREWMEPDYGKRFVNGSARKPQLVADRLAEWVERAGDEEAIRRRMESGWRFPRLRTGRYPESLDEIRPLVEMWKKSVETLVGRGWEDLRAEWVLEGLVGKETLHVAEPGDVRLGSEPWFRQVEEAHAAIAWARHLLGCDLQTGRPIRQADSLLGELLTTARRLSSLLGGWHLPGSREKRVRGAGELLKKLVPTLVAVDTLSTLEGRARHFLEKELAPLLQILEVTEAEFQRLHLQWAQVDYGELVMGEEPSFVSSPFFDAGRGWLQDAANLEPHLRQGWRLPAYGGFPSSLGEARARVAAWKEALKALFGEWAPGGEFVVRRVVVQDGNRQEVVLSLEQWLNEGEKDWQRVENAHFVRAWAWHLLGCDLRSGQPVPKPETLLAQLHRQAQKVVLLQWLARIPISWWLRQVSRWVSTALAEFFARLVRVDYLLQAEEAAASVLDRELRGEPLVTVRDLSDPVWGSGRLTWLQALAEGIRRGDVESFKNAVVQGINGLGERGLRQILGLRREASVEDIHHALAARMGQMRINGEVVEAPWWAGVPVQASASLEYRLLPVLPSKLQNQLQTAAREQVSAWEYRFGFPEILPIAVSCGSMAREIGDTLAAPVALMSPFVSLVKEILSEWDYVSASGVPVRQLEIASAGVCGEPLYELALRGAGLEDEDLKKIGQYYALYR